MPKKGGESVAFTLKQWRLVKELTIEQMAKACDVSTNTYSAWENDPGKVKVKNALKIAEALGVSVNEIFFNPETTKR
jgi:DNA-binding XRE family transcriptional regulator